MTQSYQQINVQINKSSQQHDLQVLFEYFNEKNQQLKEGGQQRQKQQNILQDEHQSDYQAYENQNKLYEGIYSEQNQIYNFQQYENFSNQEDNQQKNNKFISYNSYNIGKKTLNRIKKASDFSYSQKISNSRNLNALLSNRKIKKQCSQDSYSLGNSSSSKLSTNNLKFKNNKKLKSIVNEQFIFINPFTSTPSQTINITKFKKYSSQNYEELFKRVEAIYKKMIIYGQKLFFKQKENQEQLDNVLTCTGLKISKKLGKSKAFREFKAIYYYLKLINPEKELKDQNNIKAELFQKTYLDQFRQLMGFEKAIDKFQQKLQKNSLFGFGFSASKQKKENI